VLTISRLSRWSINYYNDTARQVTRAGLDRRRANGGLGEFSVVNTRPSSIQTFAAAILSSIWAMRCLRNIATVVACSGTSRRLWVVLGSLITSRHCPTAESPRRDIEPEPLQRGRHVARRRRDTSHARPYHMRARVRRPSNSRS